MINALNLFAAQQIVCFGFCEAVQSICWQWFTYGLKNRFLYHIQRLITEVPQGKQSHHLDIWACNAYAWKLWLGLIFGWPKAISRRDFGLLQSLFPMTVIATAQSLREERAVEGHIVISDFLANDMTVNGERQRHQEHGAVRRSHHQCLWESLWFLHKSLLFLYHKHTSSCWQRCHLLVNKWGEFIFIMDRYTSATV